MSKGSRRRPIDPAIERKVFEDNWDRIFNKNKADLNYESDNPLERPFEPQLERIEEKVDGLLEAARKLQPYTTDGNSAVHFEEVWQHYCPHNGHMCVGVGEACNWCGMKEDGSLD